MRTGDKSQKTEGRNLGRGTPVASRTHRPNPEILTRRPETEPRVMCAFLGAQGDCAAQLRDVDTSVGPSVPTGLTPSACCSGHHDAPQFPLQGGPHHAAARRAVTRHPPATWSADAPSMQTAARPESQPPESEPGGCRRLAVRGPT